jgi:hypothetical protein
MILEETLRKKVAKKEENLVELMDRKKNKKLKQMI